jgi:hypothetical protein
MGTVESRARSQRCFTYAVVADAKLSPLSSSATAAATPIFHCDPARRRGLVLICLVAHHVIDKNPSRLAYSGYDAYPLFPADQRAARDDNLHLIMQRSDDLAVWFTTHIKWCAGWIIDDTWTIASNRW